MKLLFKILFFFVVCPAGFYCPNGTTTARENPCPIGTYSNTTGLESLAECRDCPAGFYCEAENITEPTGLCSPGYYCVLKSDTLSPPTVTATGGPCHQGTYCEAGASTPIPCPKGTYGDRALLPSLADCTICPPGEFCASSGLSATDGPCLAGYYCSNGSEASNPVGQTYGDECPPGHYCPSKSYQPVPCVAGTYQPSSRMTNDSACLVCEPGKYCNASGLAAVIDDCSAGFYCVQGSSSKAPTDGTSGDICPAGSYCPVGSHIHIFCPNGTYTNHTGASECYECPEGYYCNFRDRAELCPTGYYCPSGTGIDTQPCPAGTYGPTTGLRNVTECTQCDGGRYCASQGLSATSGQCTQGYYCTSGKFTDDF